VAAPAIQPHHLVLAAAMHRQKAVKNLPWREWHATNFASHTNKPFAERHVRLWEWISTLEPGVKPRPRVEVCARGGGKS
jgi:hypothetical protein